MRPRGSRALLNMHVVPLSIGRWNGNMRGMCDYASSRSRAWVLYIVQVSSRWNTLDG